MSLGAAAQSKRAEAAEAARQQANKINEDRIAARIASINERTGYSAIYLDTVDYINGYTLDRWTSRPVEARTVKVDRFQVDDVVFRWTQSRDPRENSAGVLDLEQQCSHCGLPCHDHVGIGLRIYGNEGTDEAKRARTEQAVGERMGNAVCASCHKGMPRNCPTCGRSN